MESPANSDVILEFSWCGSTLSTQRRIKKNFSVQCQITLQEVGTKSTHRASSNGVKRFRQRGNQSESKYFGWRLAYFRCQQIDVPARPEKYGTEQEPPAGETFLVSGGRGYPSTWSWAWPWPRLWDKVRARALMRQYLDGFCVTERLVGREISGLNIGVFRVGAWMKFHKVVCHVSIQFFQLSAETSYVNISSRS